MKMTQSDAPGHKGPDGVVTYHQTDEDIVTDTGVITSSIGQSRDQIVVHVIDDNGVIRRAVRSALSAAFVVHGDSAPIRVWKSVRQLDKAWEKKAKDAPTDGDIAVCDLFAIDYYDEAAKKNRYYSKVPSRLRTPENVKRAVLDNIETHFPKLTRSGIHILVLSYVFVMLADKGDNDGVNEVRDALTTVGVDDADVFDKPKGEFKVDYLTPLVDRVVERLESESD